MSLPTPDQIKEHERLVHLAGLLVSGCGSYLSNTLGRTSASVQEAEGMALELVVAVGGQIQDKADKGELVG